MKQYAWLDKKIGIVQNSGFPFFDEGFLYADGLFETMRTYGGGVFLLERHLNRLLNSCPIMGIKKPQKRLLINAVLETVKANKLNSGYVRLNVWRRNKGAGIFVFTKPRTFYKDKDYQKGFCAVIFRDTRQNESSPLAKVKSLNHYFYILLAERAKKMGADEAIILNSKGNICEGARSNIFIVNNGKVLTPSLDCGCLPGITRQVVSEIVKQSGIVLKEGKVKPKNLLKAEEAFLTNSLIEIMPLTKIDNKFIAGAKIGKITKLIMDKYRRLVREG